MPRTIIWLYFRLATSFCSKSFIRSMSFINHIANTRHIHHYYICHFARTERWWLIQMVSVLQASYTALFFSNLWTSLPVYHKIAAQLVLAGRGWHYSPYPLDSLLKTKLFNSY